MNTKMRSLPAKVAKNLSRFDRTVLVLQGGGALGAYQAGVFVGITEAGIAPDWIAGVSIGAINAALIAGNTPERRIARLRQFWERVSARTSFTPAVSLDPLRSMFNAWNAAS